VANENMAIIDRLWDVQGTCSESVVGSLCRHHRLTWSLPRCQTCCKTLRETRTPR